MTLLQSKVINEYIVLLWAEYIQGRVHKCQAVIVCIQEYTPILRGNYLYLSTCASQHSVTTSHNNIILTSTNIVPPLTQGITWQTLTYDTNTDKLYKLWHMLIRIIFPTSLFLSLSLSLLSSALLLSYCLPALTRYIWFMFCLVWTLCLLLSLVLDGITPAFHFFLKCQLHYLVPKLLSLGLLDHLWENLVLESWI